MERRRGAGRLAYTSGLLLVIVFQAMTFIAALTFMILGSRQQSTFVPRRDYATFVQSVTEHAPALQHAP